VHNGSLNAGGVFYWWIGTRPVPLKRPAVKSSMRAEGLFKILSDPSGDTKWDKALVKKPATRATGTRMAGLQETV
jgi:hypothetical protein